MHLRQYFDDFSEAKTIFGYKKNKHGNVFETEEYKRILDIIEFVQLIPVIEF